MQAALVDEEEDYDSRRRAESDWARNRVRLLLLSFEDVMNIHDLVKPDGVIVQYGGQTPLNLARQLHDAGVKIIGTSVESIEAAEDRKKFNILVDRLKILQPPGGTATNVADARKVAASVGYPVLVR